LNYNSPIVSPRGLASEAGHNMSDINYQTNYQDRNLNITVNCNDLKDCIIHFKVNDGEQQNLSMPRNSNKPSEFNFAINNINTDNHVQYSFTTINNNSIANDSSWFSWPEKSLNTISFTNHHWITTFFDDFNGPLNRNIWNVEINNSGGGNNEAQAYIDDTSTVRTENSCLILQANKANVMGKSYTSGRINSIGKLEIKYGKIEAKIKMPKTACLWSAMWCLPADCKPWGHGCAEIDIVEFVGRWKNQAAGSINYDPWPNNKWVSNRYTLTDGKNFYDDFHVFGINWQPNKIEYFIDGNLYGTFGPESLQSKWTCNDANYYIIFNVAVSGTLGGEITCDDLFPDRMLVDWIKISELSM